MSIGGGGVENVGKAAEYYKPIDQAKIQKSSNPNKFSDVLHSTTKIEKAMGALEAQAARGKASIAPNHADIDSMIKASGLTNDQVGKLMERGANNTIASLNAPLTSDDIKLGTDLALKKLAKEMEVQMMSMFYTMMDNAREINPEGGFGEQLFRGQYLTEVVKSSSDKDEELGEIGLAIYRNLVQDDNVKKVRNVR